MSSIVWSMPTTAETTAAWRRAGETLDLAATAGCLDAEVQVVSPLTAAFRFTGREQVTEMFRAAFTVIDNISYHTETGDEATRALFYRGRCRGQDFEEAQLLRFDASGQIRELTLFGRPLPGLTAVLRGIGPELLRAKRPWLARVIGLAAAPLDVMSRVGERRLMPMGDPSRR
jgi:hypothetical protein